MSNQNLETRAQRVLINTAALRDDLLICGNFDKQHLMDIHAFLFEPFQGDAMFNPGKMRGEVPEGFAHSKMRDSGYRVYYSPMDKSAQDRLDAVLEKMKPDKLYELDKESLTKELSKNYTELDYIHPFEEGNSRTLRAFFSQCAEEIGYKLKLDKESSLDREAFHKARDKATLEKAHDDMDIKYQYYRDQIKYTFTRELGKEKSLEDIFKESLHAMNFCEKKGFRDQLRNRIDTEKEPRGKDLLKNKLELFDKCIRDRDKGLDR